VRMPGAGWPHGKRMPQGDESPEVATGQDRRRLPLSPQSGNRLKSDKITKQTSFAHRHTLESLIRERSGAGRLRLTR
jgi:hypothetical protein